VTDILFRYYVFRVLIVISFLDNLFLGCVESDFMFWVC